MSRLMTIFELTLQNAVIVVEGLPHAELMNAFQLSSMLTQKIAQRLFDEKSETNGVLTTHHQTHKESIREFASAQFLLEDSGTDCGIVENQQNNAKSSTTYPVELRQFEHCAEARNYSRFSARPTASPNVAPQDMTSNGRNYPLYHNLKEWLVKKQSQLSAPAFWTPPSTNDKQQGFIYYPASMNERVVPTVEYYHTTPIARHTFTEAAVPPMKTNSGNKSTTNPREFTVDCDGSGDVHSIIQVESDNEGAQDLTVSAAAAVPPSWSSTVTATTTSPQASILLPLSTEHTSTVSCPPNPCRTVLTASGDSAEVAGDKDTSPSLSPPGDEGVCVPREVVVTSGKRVSNGLRRRQCASARRPPPPTLPAPSVTTLRRTSARRRGSQSSAAVSSSAPALTAPTESAPATVTEVMHSTPTCVMSTTADDRTPKKPRLHSEYCFTCGLQFMNPFSFVEHIQQVHIGLTPNQIQSMATRKKVTKGASASDDSFTTTGGKGLDAMLQEGPTVNETVQSTTPVPLVNGEGTTEQPSAPELVIGGDVLKQEFNSPLDETTFQAQPSGLDLSLASGTEGLQQTSAWVIVCPHCQRRMINANAFQQHVATMHPEITSPIPSFLCKHCGITIHDVAQLHTHSSSCLASPCGQWPVNTFWT